MSHLSLRRTFRKMFATIFCKFFSFIIAIEGRKNVQVIFSYFLLLLCVFPPVLLHVNYNQNKIMEQHMRFLCDSPIQ